MSIKGVVMTKILVMGICGKMGSRIAALAKEDPGIEMVGGTELKGSPSIYGSQIVDDLNKVIDKADVLIDFTTIPSTLNNLKIAEKAKKAMIIGTTGFKDEELAVIKNASKNIPIVLSSNMSIGVNLLFKLVKEIAQVVPHYDIEIIEAHHNQKKDAPSGTAVKLAQEINSVLDNKLKKVAGRDGICGPRKKNEIGILSVRAGDIVGDHTIMYAGPGERIELTHRAHSRDIFASGALVAAKWIAGKKPGLYSMQDVLF